MEPASTLATLAFAAAATLPSPRIEVTLRNWENQMQDVVNIYCLERVIAYHSTNANNCLAGVGAQPIAQLLRGYNGRGIALPLKESLPDSATITIMRLVPSKDPNKCLDFNFMQVRHSTGSSIDLVCCARIISKDVMSTLNRARKNVTWDTNKPPYCITLEIDGEIETSFDDARISIKHDVWQLERLT